MRSLLILLVAAMPFGATAQLNNGLIAHWPFNGSTADATGKGHNGTMYNVTPIAGKTGQPNTAYYFSGDTNSFITVPYQPDLNVDSFSIAAVFKPMGFYTGLCQGNTILRRGTENQSGAYNLQFFDNAFDSSCAVTNDTTMFTFSASITGHHCHHKDWDVPPYVHTGKWYTVVVTYKNHIVRVYVDGVLTNTTSPYMSSAIGNSTEGISIGANRFGNPQLYPFTFKGIIDDLRLYNRPLTQQEIDTYTVINTPADTTQSVAMTMAPDIIISPNPSAGEINISAQLRTSQTANIEVSNMLGQVVYKKEVSVINGSVEHKVQLAGNPAGHYILRVVGRSGETGISRFILQE